MNAPRIHTQKLLVALLTATLGFSMTAHAETKPAPKAPAQTMVKPALVKLVSLNAATLEELMTLPHVGPKTAALIVKSRPYADGQEFQDKVMGIGPKTWAALEKLVSFELPKPPVPVKPVPARKK